MNITNPNFFLTPHKIPYSHEQRFETLEQGLMSFLIMEFQSLYIQVQPHVHTYPIVSSKQIYIE
jgi:hypothetical protein